MTEQTFTLDVIAKAMKQEIRTARDLGVDSPTLDLFAANVLLRLMEPALADVKTFCSAGRVVTP